MRRVLWPLWGLFLVGLTASQAVSQGPAAWGPPNGVESGARLTPAGLPADGPGWNGDGTALVFHGGAEGAAEIYWVPASGGEPTQLTDNSADDRDPAFTADGDRIIFSSNRDGDYDLYTVPAGGGDATQVTDLPGHEMAPVVSPVLFDFYALADDGCGYVWGDRVDGYQKVAFTRRWSGTEAVWVTALDSNAPDQHTTQISPEGVPCAQAAWSGDGLGLTWACDEDGTLVYQADASWQHSFNDALRALEVEPWEDEAVTCGEVTEEGWATDECATRLPRQYTAYSGEARSDASANFSNPSFSANQVLLVSDGPGGAHYAWRTGGDWQPLALGGASRAVSWSPDGSRVAYVAGHEGEEAVYLAQTDFYLQDVVDLVDYPELWGAGTSRRLHENLFVARPSDHREFHKLYDRDGYAGRAPFITADAALQAFHDEFTVLLRESEQRAAAELLTLVEGLSQHYRAGDDELSRFYAAYFAVPAALLSAAGQVDLGLDMPPEPWMVHECEYMRERLEELDEQERAQYDEDCVREEPEPVADQVARGLAAYLEGAPEGVRGEVERYLALITAHEGVTRVAIPGFGEDYPVDFSQFVVRGHYATTDLRGYFLAMMWLGLVPLPLGETSFELLDVLEREDEGGERLMTLWESIDQMVGGIMGRPVDATVSHLHQLREANPGLLAPYQDAEVKRRLLELRGPIPFRGMVGAMDGGGYPLLFSLFPRRYGRDVEFFTRLTHPDIELRGMPSALDVLAAAGGNERAAQLAGLVSEGAEFHTAYTEALAELGVETAGLPDTYWTTDIYHLWLAAILALAAPLDLPDDTPLRFTQSDAWRDRELVSALAAYTQLKYSAVLYSFQEGGVECGGDIAYYAFTEKPVIPAPRAYVDPQPAFFRGLAALSERMYDSMWGEQPPWRLEYRNFRGEDVDLRVLTQRLSDAVDKQLAGEPLSEDENEWLLNVGAILEVILLGREPDDAAFGADEGRMERGVAIATDIYTNPMRGEVVQIAIGRLLDLYVAVPNHVGQRMTQGGMFSFYEFPHPMNDRLTDEAWSQLLDSDEPPVMPSWTTSFVEELGATEAGPD